MNVLKKFYFSWKERRFWKLNKKSPEEIFTDAYKNNVWGGQKGEFHSGSGTANPNTDIYVKNVAAFIKSHSIKKIVDLGSGDFKVMHRVVEQSDVSYVGVDVVKDLVAHNNREFGNDRVSFQHLNIIDDALPAGDLVLIRQVLQHLGNEEISKILQKLSVFQFVLITEHLPVTDDVIYNVDKIHGPHIRMKFNSGVFIDKPPFNMKNAEILFEYREDDPIKGKLVPAVIRTYLITNPLC